MKKVCLCLTIFLLGLTNAARATDNFAIEVGTGNLANSFQLALQRNWNDDCALLRDHQLRTLWTVSLSEISEKKYRNVPDLQHSLTVLGLTPILRWQGTPDHPSYAELGIGINYMTEKYDNNDRTMSSEFQFGDHIGVGYLFANHFDLSLNFRHYSDAGIRMPNPAVNFVNIRLSHAF